MGIKRKSIQDYLDGTDIDDATIYEGESEGLNMPIQYQQKIITDAIAAPAIKAIESSSNNMMLFMAADKFLDRGTPVLGVGKSSDQGDGALAQLGLRFLQPAKRGRVGVIQAVLKALR